MEWQVILALVLGVPIILSPAAYVWYLNIGGIYAAIREKKATREVVVKGHAVARKVA